jgi:N-acetyl-anhydromuramyl-L-alanine amidase AmpD
MYVVIHTADSGSAGISGVISWQKNPSAQVSSHFIVAKDGTIVQMLDTDKRSWCQIEGNPYSIAIENEGNENTPLTDAQLRANAKIFAKAHQVYGIPLQLTGKVGVRGLGHHSMGAESGVNWGHSECPGSIIKG